jgi:hypothetical protein
MKEKQSYYLHLAMQVKITRVGTKYYKAFVLLVLLFLERRNPDQKVDPNDINVITT